MITTPEEYITEVTEEVQQCLSDKGCQPILFIGSGLSKRLFKGPSWVELLERLASGCPEIKKELAYYRQQSDDNLIDIGETFADCYMEWAWGTGKRKFPKELFESPDKQIFVKHIVCELFKKITPDALTGIRNRALQREIRLLQSIRPHAVITTNYDSLLEIIFPEYEPVIGQRILRTSYSSVGEIYKVHGCVSEPQSIVLTRKDYDEFLRKKKYLSAKLLTYFAEHPLLFIGYSAEDPNIKTILADIDEILAAEDELVSNIFLLSWDKEFDTRTTFPKEKVIHVEENRTIRIKNIVANSFEWVFDAFASDGELEQVSPKVLRTILARTYEMVRHDLPRKIVEVDYTQLERVTEGKGELPKLYGIATLDNPSTTNAYYPYTISQVGEQLGFPGWHGARKLLDTISSEKGVDITESDNQYHIKVKTGRGDKSATHNKYSDAAVSLLEKVKDGKEYKLMV
ncbi:SIR2 family protein [Bremerella cremea]|uniref:SIR2 family protein n=1 Tax=Bremerella cremea TaxID=1031537 RepID=A0A368KMT0_9BACT|nr:SIR2 family protein [Bremerella cremea]RCS44020.1 SIR2 family protein [Bremerella cremea]